MRTITFVRLAAVAAGLALASASQAQGEKPAAAQPAGGQPAADKPAAQAAKEQLVHVTLKTSHGDIVLELDQAKAPKSVENFVKYVDDKFYDGTIFHRVIPGFMVQGGGFTPDMVQKKTGPTIANEWKNGLKNKRGTVAMARTQIADSATSQFFINVADNSFLDEPRDGAAYAVFGRVVAGMDVVDKIQKVPTTNKGGHQNVPAEPVVIQSARKLTAEEAAAVKGDKK